MAALLMMISGSTVCGQTVVEDWLILPSNASATGNQWVTTDNAGHAIDFIRNDASDNGTGRNLLVIQAGEAGDSALQVLDADTGQHVNTRVMSPTFDTFRDHARMATTDDGWICVVGAQGTVQLYNPSSGGAIKIVDRAVYTPLNLPSTTCRAFDVSGSVSAGTLKLFVGKGTSVVVFGNQPGSATIFNYLGHFNTGATGDLQLLVEQNGYLYASSVPSPEIRRFQLTYLPFTVTGPITMGGAFSSTVKSGMALNSTGNLAGIHLNTSSNSEFAIANVTTGAAPFIANIPTLPTLDRITNGVYDGGPGKAFLNNGGTPDVCMDPRSGTIYGYVPGTSSGAIMRLSISSSSVGDWMMY